MWPTSVVVGRGVGGVAVAVWFVVWVWSGERDRRAIQRTQRLLAMWDADAGRDVAFRRFVDAEAEEPTLRERRKHATVMTVLAVMFVAWFTAR
jgi:hypothetical protein